MKSLRFTLCLLCFLSVGVMTVFSQSNSQFAVADSLFISGNYTLARTRYNEALQTKTGNALTWNRLGFCNYQLKNFPEAITQFEKSLSLNPAVQLKTVVLFRLAKSYAGIGDKSNSLSSLQKAVDNGFVNWQEIEADPNFEFLKKETQFNAIQETVLNKIYPCRANPKNREFDFWIGNWTVYDTNTGKVAGRSEVNNILGECVLMENWEPAFGTPGKSFNVYNADEKKWRQTWVDAQGSMVEYGLGEYRDNMMRFILRQTEVGSEMKRLTFYNIKEKNEVKQVGEVSTDKGQTWKIEFDLTYKKKAI